MAIKKTRKFGKCRFKWYGRTKSKTAAKSWAKRVRKHQKIKTRLVKSGRGIYDIYVHRGKKKC